MIYLVTVLRKALYWNPFPKKRVRWLNVKENGLKSLDEVSKEIFSIAILEGSFYEHKVEMK